MGKEIITFGDFEIAKHKFHHRKNLTFLEDVNIEKYKCLVWLLDAKKIIKILMNTKMMIIKLSHYP